MDRAFGYSREMSWQCLFEPRVIEFDQKRVGLNPVARQNVTDEIVEQITEHVVSHFSCCQYAC